MPLFHKSGEKAFKHNVREEMHEGKPQKQSLAIAFNLKRRTKKAKGERSRRTTTRPEAKCLPLAPSLNRLLNPWPRVVKCVPVAVCGLVSVLLSVTTRRFLLRQLPRTIPRADE